MKSRYEDERQQGALDFTERCHFKKLFVVGAFVHGRSLNSILESLELGFNGLLAIVDAEISTAPPDGRRRKNVR
ncbi:MAG: hypothetical protein ABGY21_13440 [Pseudomonadota bacterium]